MWMLVLPVLNGVVSTLLFIPFNAVVWNGVVLSRDTFRTWWLSPGLGVFLLLLMNFILPAVSFGGYGFLLLATADISGGTPGLNCSQGGVSRLYAGAATPSQPPREISFFSQCGSGEVELVGYERASAGTKCCVPAPRGRFTCDGFGLVPDLVQQADLLFENETRSSYAACCPELFADVIPAGFVTMILGSVVGVLVNVLLNGMPILLRFITAASQSASVPIELGGGEVPEVSSAEIAETAETQEHPETLEQDGEASCMMALAKKDPTISKLNDIGFNYPEVTTTLSSLPVRTAVEGNRNRMSCCVSNNGAALAVGNRMTVEFHSIRSIVENHAQHRPHFIVKLEDIRSTSEQTSPEELRATTTTASSTRWSQCPTVCGVCSIADVPVRRVPVVIAACFTADDDELLCVSDDVSCLYVVCVFSRKVTVCQLSPAPLWTDGACSVCVSPDSHTAVVHSDEGVTLCRRPTRDAPFVLQRHYVRSSLDVTACMFSPFSAARLFVLTQSQRPLDIDLESGNDEQLMFLCEKTVRPAQRARGRGCMAISEDGLLLAFGGIDGLHLQDRESGALLYRDELLVDSLSLAFTPCGRFLVENNGDDCRFWSVTEDRRLVLYASLSLGAAQSAVQASSMHFPDSTPSTMLLINVVERSTPWYERLHYRVPGVRIQLLDVEKDLQSFRDDAVLTHNRFVADLFDVSQLTLLKCAVGVLAGVCLAVMSAADVRQDTTLNNWASYEAFVVSLVNGPALANVVDIVSTAALCRYFRTANMFPVARFPAPASCSLPCVTPTVTSLATRIAMGVLACLGLLVVVTHWLPGLAVFATLLVTIVGPLLCFLVVGTVFTAFRLEYCTTRRIFWRAAAILVAIGIAIALNFILVILLRFPVNLAILLYGNSSYPYLGPSTSESPNKMLNGALHALLYMLQISSASCSVLRSTASASSTFSYYLTLL